MTRVLSFFPIHPPHVFQVSIRKLERERKDRTEEKEGKEGKERSLPSMGAAIKPGAGRLREEPLWSHG